MASSNSERSVGAIEAVEKHVEHPKLKKLKKLLEIYFWKVEHHRKLFLSEFGVLISDWKEELPNLHDFFTKEEMDWVLVASIKATWPRFICQIVEFVARSGYKDEPDLDEDGKPLLRRTTAVHHVRLDKTGSWMNKQYLKNLFQIYDKFHVNYIDDSGYTHFHIACMYNLDDVVEKFLEAGQDPNCLVPETGDSMLYYVAATNLEYPEEATIRTLLKHGADPNQTNKDGSTVLQALCQNRYPVILMLLRSIDEFELTVQLNIQDNEGNTALHLFLKDYTSRNIVEELLRRGSDPNLANAKGQTPLHIMCQQSDIIENSGLSQLFFRVNDEMENTVHVDARDNEGNTALHLAVACGNAEMIEPLLMRGADPSLANEKGLLPQHLVDRSDIVRIFFSSENKEWQQTVRIDARDNYLGRTALEWAVTRCWPHTVKSLLDCGADLSGFVFPTPSDSDRYQGINYHIILGSLSEAVCKFYDLNLNDLDIYALNRSCSATKLAAATGLLAIVELLETRGYELNRDDALKFMGFVDKYGLYESADFSTNKNVDDLVDSLFEEMAKKSTYMDYFKFASTYGFLKVPKESKGACSLRLCEKVLRKFFHDWALDPFLELMHYRLSTKRCEIIIEKLQNKDLFNICLAAADRSSR